VKSRSGFQSKDTKKVQAPGAGGAGHSRTLIFYSMQTSDTVKFQMPAQLCPNSTDPFLRQTCYITVTPKVSWSFLRSNPQTQEGDHPRYEICG